jgi:hypothetical protein
VGEAVKPSSGAGRYDEITPGGISTARWKVDGDEDDDERTRGERASEEGRLGWLVPVGQEMTTGTTVTSAPSSRPKSPKSPRSPSSPQLQRARPPHRHPRPSLLDPPTRPAPLPPIRRVSNCAPYLRRPRRPPSSRPLPSCPARPPPANPSSQAPVADPDHLPPSVLLRIPATKPYLNLSFIMAAR